MTLPHPSPLSVLYMFVGMLIALVIVPWGRLHFYWNREWQTRLNAAKVDYLPYDFYWIFMMFFGASYGAWVAIFFHNIVSDDWYFMNAMFVLFVVPMIAIHGHGYQTPVHVGVLGPWALVVLGLIVSQLGFTVKYEQAHTPPGSDINMISIAAISFAAIFAFLWMIWNMIVTIFLSPHWEEMSINVANAVDSRAKPTPTPGASTPTTTDKRHQTEVALGPFITFPHAE